MTSSSSAGAGRRAGSDRRYDVVLLGATGFVGRLTADYLARNAPDTLRWALAGRNADKLAGVRGDLATSSGRWADLPLESADVTDPVALRALAESTRVLVTTVGPYVLYGDAVAEACAASGTDYLDLTGEPEFIDRSYVAHHRTAQRTGARLVHAAGFDSVPHDLGALFTVLALPRDVPLTVAGYVRVSAAPSGGTFYSLLTALGRPRENLAARRDRRTAEPVRDPDRRVRVVTGHPHRDPTQPGWALPLPTADPQIVARSAQSDPRYGPDFRYSHFASMPHLATAVGAVAGLGVLAGVAQIPPVQRALLSRLAPGEGPGAERRSRSWYTVTFVGEGGGHRVVTRVSGGDPGYDETAVMLAESALCLALDEGLPDVAGQVTTAQAMGETLIARLQRAGTRFELLG